MPQAPLNPTVSSPAPPVAVDLEVLLLLLLLQAAVPAEATLPWAPATSSTGQL